MPGLRLRLCGLVLLALSAVCLHPDPAYAASMSVPLRSVLTGSFYRDSLGVPADSSAIMGLRYTEPGSAALGMTEKRAVVGLGDRFPGSFGAWTNRIFADGSVVVGAGALGPGTERFLWVFGDGRVSFGDRRGNF